MTIMTASPSSGVGRLVRRLFSWTIAALCGGLLYKALQKWAEYRKRIEDDSHELVVEHSYLRKDWEEPKPAPEPKGPKGSKGPTGSKEKPEPADITQFGLPDDQFELSTKLDAGGQGTVFRCIRLNTQHEYAVKVINTTLIEKSERQLASLRSEIRIMRELHHPHIVNLHEAFWTDDQCLIVMDLAHGGNLFDKLHKDIMDCQRDPFPGLGGKEFSSKHVAAQLLEGIGYMHAHHVLHRDLKLENILITHSSFSAEEDCPLHHIKIADFGLSTSKERKATSKATLRRTMTAVGTPDYVAPEVLKGKYDERVDYWSFGVILYAMLCGRMPFVVRCLSPEEHKEQVSQLRKSNQTPAPGQYVWHDDVHLRKKPVWSMVSPDRKNLDLMLPTWTPASGSLQPRAPDPGEYGCQDTCGRNGPYRPPKWSQARSSGRPCLAPDPPEVVELENKIPSSFGGENPLQAWPPKWSVCGKDRSQLPNDIATWTPKPNTDIRPGPGAYNLDRKSKWKASSRSGCTWGRRLPNLHPEVRAFITQTSGARMKYGDWMRYRPEAG